MILQMNSDRLISILNWLFILFPISMIAGNSITNINFFFFILIGIIYLLKKEIKFNNIFLLSTFLLFCVILIFSSLINQFNIEKSFFYLRIFIFYLICTYLLTEKSFSIKKIFYFYSLVVGMICLDLIIQNAIGYNIIGFKFSEYIGATSFFYDEKIAGSFVQNFGFFLVFVIFDFFKKNNVFYVFLKAILISLISIAIFVSLQRMPMIIWTIFLLIYGSVYYKKKLLSILISFAILFVFINNFSTERSNEMYKSFFSNVKVIAEKSLTSYQTNKDKKKLEEIRSDMSKVQEFVRGSGHANLFGNAMYIWDQNKLFGIGYKNFYEVCQKEKLFRCATHPHNYYLDILVSTGAIGLTSFLIFLASLLFKSIQTCRSYYQNGLTEKLSITFILLINYLMIFFPFKSSGSFFTTSNVTYIIIIISLLTSQLTKKSS